MRPARSRLSPTTFAIAASAVALTAPFVAAGPAAAEPTAPGPPAAEPLTDARFGDDVSVEQTDLGAGLTAYSGEPTEIEQTALSAFHMAAVTWEGEFDPEAGLELRLRTGDGWGEWQPLERTDGEDAPRSTEPMWSSDAADAVAIRLGSGQAAPEGLRIVTVDPGESSEPPGAQSYAAGQPDIIPRSGWGAAPAESCDATIGSMQGVVLHHTAGANSYSKEESAGIVRSYQTMHMVTNDWCDLGYNFLVDKYGQIFEGRAGSLDDHVRGAHAGVREVNDNTTGVAMMGNFESSNIWNTEWDTLRDATTRLIAWRLDDYGLRPLQTLALNGQTEFRVSGHRNWLATACPGQYGQDWLDAGNGLRADLDAML
ncbi:hypothetical protein BHE97_00965 [Aeromicrobium sp. PE09-221]|uniref:N-acetylmuramoyl-L-alanine amidase n=1 Tax=Aeromicrobium sp. PE09-221 TaxID=1898043 RepID=UPI000B3E8D8F|nr:N-acetylmuramoyl-L-alanine amidase [Aeromicrobium sp. PE09-221]OUZ12811.1 hypothetical protein BHE97_00965 [Aeromicrobium sp. PE09-221]